MKKQTLQRLVSLDLLRGFDLFCLVVLETIMHPLARAIDNPHFDWFMKGFSHVEWYGFSSWDLVMPLFMFMAGVSIPFALSRYKRESNFLGAYKRIGRRVLLLWFFGMICQGNLLALDLDRIYLFSNTLQSIAVGYLISAILFLHFDWKGQLITALLLLLTYWIGMEFASVDGYGAGDYTPDHNWAEWVDRTLLGRFRDGASVENGEVVFAGYYHYTWIWSSLTFGVTVISGMLAGHILKSDREMLKKAALLVGWGVLLVALGWLWNMEMPVIKKIWTGSMVLVSSGYSFLLMALFYYLFDCRKGGKYFMWLNVYGMNSIAAYMLSMCVSFRSIGHSLFFGLEPYMGAFYPALIAFSEVAVIYLLLRLFYEKKWFLRV